MKFKRCIPSNKLQNERVKILKLCNDITPVFNSDELGVGFENGNSKTGFSNKNIEATYIWNLPPVVTCPGASRWCLENCYNADDREDKFNYKLWKHNWWRFENDREILRNNIMNFLECKSNTVVRLHSSGDFYSNEYLQFWIEVIQLCEHIHFWAYTRSWRCKNLRDKISELEKLSNINLIYSWDKSMSEYPKNNNISIVLNSYEEMLVEAIKLNGKICPEQYSGSESCINCMYCITGNPVRVLFHVH